ncbi:uncharacterized protein LOC117325138 [Pecten maximus]|uniref:uncharacterized protein LOC117325138 n=1 Tax=Pecten maximus TaxID=6579 RepID=UPI0014587921|nr:uncharacterized protein LOC117325138 [Pecten maximus]
MTYLLNTDHRDPPSFPRPTEWFTFQKMASGGGWSSFALLISTVILLQVFNVSGKEFKLYAFEFITPNIHRTNARSGAERELAVALNTGDMIKLVFCLTEKADVQVSGIVLSNDGGEDELSILLDWDEVGTTRSKYTQLSGQGWNVFEATNPVGLRRTLAAGRHSVTVNVTSSDEFGVELDAVMIKVSDEDLNEEAFTCNVFCFNDITYAHVEGKDFIGSARMEQRSNRTDCAEEDNIRIPFYHSRITKFEVKAMHPKYKAFVNNRESDFTNCRMVNDLLWRFENLTYPFSMKQFKRGKAIVTHDKNDDHNIIVTFFSPDGPRKGVVDSEIGSQLYLELRSVVAPIEIGFTYYGRKKEWTVPEFITFSPDKVNHTWHIPDYTWNESPENIIRLLLPLELPFEIDVAIISLNKRKTKEDTAFKVFDNSEKIIEGVNVDFFWRSDGEMVVKMKDSGEVYTGADYVRIYTHLPWGNQEFSQVFVLYRDGNFRILPLTPPGVDWIPFGSSLIIGETDPDYERPFASISEVEIDVKKNILNLTYANGNTVTIELHIAFAETSLTVTNINFKNRSLFPFMIYNSMWVSDGNADVDRVRVNGNEARRIMADWRHLYGTSVAFYRQCLSRHNTMSPDIRVELLEEE